LAKGWWRISEGQCVNALTLPFGNYSLKSFWTFAQFENGQFWPKQTLDTDLTQYRWCVPQQPETSFNREVVLGVGYPCNGEILRFFEEREAPRSSQGNTVVTVNIGPNQQAVLLGQFGDWGAYKASPGGKKVCYALSKPTSAVTDPPGRNRNPGYASVSTRPAENVRNEVSVIVGYSQKSGVEASATIGSTSYVMYTQNDGTWVKNSAEEAQMVETMREGADLVIKSVSTGGTKTTDTYSLKGLSEALDKVADECK
jgi:hypothetical protein